MSYPPQQYQSRSRSSPVNMTFIALLAVLIIIIATIAIFVFPTVLTCNQTGTTCISNTSTNVFRQNNIYINLAMQDNSGIFSLGYSAQAIIQTYAGASQNSCQGTPCQWGITRRTLSVQITVSGPQNYNFLQTVNLGWDDLYEHNYQLANPYPPNGTYNVLISISALNVPLGYPGPTSISCQFYAPLQQAVTCG